MKLKSITGNGTEAINQIPAEVWVKLAEERISSDIVKSSKEMEFPLYGNSFSISSCCSIYGISDIYLFILGNSCCIYTWKICWTVTSTSDYLNNLVMKGFSDKRSMGCSNDDVGSHLVE